MGNYLHSTTYHGRNNKDRRERISTQNTANIEKWWRITLHPPGIPSRRYLATETPTTLRPILWRALPKRARHRTPNNCIFEAEKRRRLRYTSQAPSGAWQIIINHHGGVQTGIESRLTPPNFSHCRPTQQAAASWQWDKFLKKSFEIFLSYTCNRSTPQRIFHQTEGVSFASAYFRFFRPILDYSRRQFAKSCASLVNLTRLRANNRRCIHRPSSDANTAHSSPEEANAKSAPSADSDK